MKVPLRSTPLLSPLLLLLLPTRCRVFFGRLGSQGSNWNLGSDHSLQSASGVVRDTGRSFSLNCSVFQWKSERCCASSATRMTLRLLGMSGAKKPRLSLCVRSKPREAHLTGDAGHLVGGKLCLRTCRLGGRYTSRLYRTDHSDPMVRALNSNSSVPTWEEIFWPCF